MSQQPRITVVCGHYGCGKTNLTLNLALEAAAAGERVTVADLDIVNPYFRSSEYGGLLEEQGVRLIAPVLSSRATPVRARWSSTSSGRRR